MTRAQIALDREIDDRYAEMEEYDPDRLMDIIAEKRELLEGARYSHLPARDKGALRSEVGRYQLS
ncbi:hypothetical protein ACFYM7_30565 [Streptomyces cyaneofuscatus]|uniref:hypothetical protein n=1 Tax=Streptomyces cyaneofuscatus TaxID=66883 RepID=UPI0036ACCC8B